MNPIEKVPEEVVPVQQEKPIALEEIKRRLEALKAKKKEKDGAWEAQAKQLADEVIEMEAGNKKLNIKTSEYNPDAGSGFTAHELSKQDEIDINIENIQSNTNTTVSEINACIIETEKLRDSAELSNKAEFENIISESRRLMEQTISEADAEIKSLQDQHKASIEQQEISAKNHEKFQREQLEVSSDPLSRTEFAARAVLDSHSMTTDGEIDSDKFTPAQREQVTNLAKEKVMSKESSIKSAERLSAELPKIERNIQILENIINDARTLQLQAGKEIENKENLINQEIETAEIKLRKQGDIIRANSPENKSFWKFQRTADKEDQLAMEERDNLISNLKLRNEEAFNSIMQTFNKAYEMFSGNDGKVANMIAEIYNFSQKEEELGRALEQHPLKFTMSPEIIKDVLSRSRRNYENIINSLNSEHKSLTKVAQNKFKNLNERITTLAGRN